MKNLFFLICLISFATLTASGQKLTIGDLIKLKGLSLNDAETLLSQRKFEFKEVRDSDDKGKDYAFSFNLDDYGAIGDEYLLLSFSKNEEIPFMVWYQLDKEGWIKIKNAMATSGYKKNKTETESDGSLTTEYTNSKFKFRFNSGKSYYGDNNGKLIYTLSVTLK